MVEIGKFFKDFQKTIEGFNQANEAADDAGLPSINGGRTNRKTDARTDRIVATDNSLEALARAREELYKKQRQAIENGGYNPTNGNQQQTQPFPQNTSPYLSSATAEELRARNGVVVNGVISEIEVGASLRRNKRFFSDSGATPELVDMVRDLESLTSTRIIQNGAIKTRELAKVLNENREVLNLSPDFFSQLESTNPLAWNELDRRLDELTGGEFVNTPAATQPSASAPATTHAPAAATTYSRDDAIADRLNEMLAGKTEQEKKEYATCLTAALIRNGVAVKVGDNPVDLLSGYIKANNPALAETLSKNDGTKDLAADKAAFNDFMKDFPNPKTAQKAQTQEQQTQSAAPTTPTGATITRGDGKTQSVQDFLNEGIENGKKRKLAEAAAREAYAKSQAPAPATPAPAASTTADPATQTPAIDTSKTKAIFEAQFPPSSITFNSSAITALSPQAKPAVASTPATKTADAETPKPIEPKDPLPVAPEPTPPPPQPQELGTTKTATATAKTKEQQQTPDPKAAEIKGELEKTITQVTSTNPMAKAVFDGKMKEYGNTLTAKGYNASSPENTLQVISELFAKQPAIYEKLQGQFKSNPAEAMITLDNTIANAPQNQKTKEKAAPTAGFNTKLAEALEGNLVSNPTLPSTTFAFSPASVKSVEQATRGIF